MSVLLIWAVFNITNFIQIYFWLVAQVSFNAATCFSCKLQPKHRGTLKPFVQLAGNKLVCLRQLHRKYDIKLQTFFFFYPSSFSQYMIHCSWRSTMYCLHHCQFSSLDCLSKIFLLKLYWIIHSYTAITSTMCLCLGPLSFSGFHLVSHEKNELLQWRLP